jgi:quercetin dioxygenase-like cupin family protein
MRVIQDLLTPAALADPTQFAGRVWRSDYLQPADRDGLTGLRFLYEPGAHSHWHVHDREQAIVVVTGHGVVTWEGLDVPHLLGPGDWWHVTPGVPHWHGATPESPFAHLAITAGGGTTRLREVPSDEYAAGVARRRGADGVA